MLDREENEKIKKSMVMLNIIWAAMLMSLLMYLVVGLILSRSISPTLDAGTLRILKSAFYSLSAVTLVAIKIVRGKMLSTKRRMPGREEQGGSPPASAFGKYPTVIILSLAMSESIGVWGLVLAILGGGRTDLYTLVGLAAAAMLFFRPRAAELKEYAEGLTSPKMTV